MDKKKLYYELLEDMEYIIKQHQKSQQVQKDFDPMANIPIDVPEGVANPEYFMPYGRLLISIDSLFRKSKNS